MEEQVVKHGYRGWKQGCRCSVCGRAQADSMARYRERKRQREAPLPVTGGGELEALTLRRIDGLGALSAYGESLASLAMTTARLIDHIGSTGQRQDLMRRSTRDLLSLMKELSAAR
ncbi:hypothetical protein [Pseudarthrobacter oxydans]|uniref:hypothetical protein n=1 Tax=Pseudarthrobacter oxydans TaxID=1671 RepID=UPI002AA8B206|nr:hypothetical protein [Pseudarthrobacter oxydans]WPU08098.1 hypothetical protein SMD14_13085 [Pseudarthrobacter oxydans]